MAVSNQLEKDGNRLDSASQKILWALRNPWSDRGWIRGGALRKSAELSQNRQVFYRVEKYLAPAGLVEERERRSEDYPREFRLTDEGREWVDAHEETLRAPTSRRETQQMALEAVDEAEAAKDSVQNYRKKVHRIKSDVDDLKDRSGEHADRFDEVTDRLDDLHSLAWGNATDIRDLQNLKVDDRESRERINAAKQEVVAENHRLAEQVEALERAVEDAHGGIETLREENTVLRERLDAVGDELDKSWTKKLRRG